MRNWLHSPLLLLEGRTNLPCNALTQNGSVFERNKPLPVKACAGRKYDPEYIKFEPIMAGGDAALMAECDECSETTVHSPVFFLFLLYVAMLCFLLICLVLLCDNLQLHMNQAHYRGQIILTVSLSQLK